MSKKIPSVGVVIIKDDSVLLVAKRNHPLGAYQLPGGQIEPSETELDAAVRELQETTGLASQPKDYIRIPTQWEATIRKDYGENIFSFTCFICTLYAGEAAQTTSASPKWVRIIDLETIPLVLNTLEAVQEAQILLRTKAL